MKELLFGWITKGQYELSFLDSIIGIIEIFNMFNISRNIYTKRKNKK